MACLAPVEEAEFSFVREAADITAPTLSKQMTILEQAGYVAVRKGYVGKRPRTWLALTPPGRAALAEYLDLLRGIAGEVSSKPGRRR
jgi:DNA-binding MarR family transcriptional regulator